MPSDDLLAIVESHPIPVALYQPACKEFVFVSDDFKGRDRVVESHPDVEDRNYFRIFRAASGRWLLFHPPTGSYVFVSRDRKGEDLLVEAHPKREERDEFEFERLDGGRYRLFNRSSGVYLFVSNDRLTRDRVVEAHGRDHLDEPRNAFELLLPEAAEYELFDLVYDLGSGELRRGAALVATGVVELANAADDARQCASTVTSVVEVSRNWWKDTSLEPGLRGTVRAGVPLLAETAATVSPETPWVTRCGAVLTRAEAVSHEIRAQVPPRSRIVARYRILLSRIAVPYRASLTVRYDGAQYDLGPFRGVYEANDCPVVDVDYSAPEPL